MLSMNECALMSLPWHMRTKSPSRSQSLRSALSWEARSTVAKLILVFSEHCSRPTAHVGLKRKKDPLCRISPSRIRWPIIEHSEVFVQSQQSPNRPRVILQRALKQLVKKHSSTLTPRYISEYVEIVSNLRVGFLCAYFECGQWTYVEILSFQDKFQACVVLSTFACFLCSWRTAGQIFWNFSLSKPYWLEPLILC